MDIYDEKLGIETVMQYIVEPKGGRIPPVDEITEDVHAIVITGSVHNAYSDEEWVHKLLDFIKRMCQMSEKARNANRPRCMDSSSRYQVYGDMFWSSNPVSRIRFPGQA